MSHIIPYSLARVLTDRVHREIYARTWQIASICALRIYCNICICATRDHEPRRLASRRSAAGMSRRRFDLKVKLQVIRLPFNRPAPSTFVKRRRAIPTSGYRQAPCHESGLRRTRKSTKSRGVSLPTARQSPSRYAPKQGLFSCCSCAVKTAFVSRASDADRRSRRRGDDWRRSSAELSP